MMAFAFTAVTGFYAVVTLLHLILPAYRCTGYACDWLGAPLTYRLNGLLVLGAVCIFHANLHEELAATAAREFWACLAAANVLGLVGAAALLASGAHEPACRCLTTDQTALRERAARGEDVMQLVAASPARGRLAHFFFGVRFNPRVALPVFADSVDLKMLLYQLGAAALVDVDQGATPHAAEKGADLAVRP